MGRRKIRIKYIEDDRVRTATLKKRQNGLVKKAMELALLCGVDVCLVVANQDRVVEFSHPGLEKVLRRRDEIDPSAHKRFALSQYEAMYGAGGCGLQLGVHSTPSVGGRARTTVTEEAAPALASATAVAPATVSGRSLGEMVAGEFETDDMTPSHALAAARRDSNTSNQSGSLSSLADDAAQLQRYRAYNNPLRGSTVSLAATAVLGLSSADGAGVSASTVPAPGLPTSLILASGGAGPIAAPPLVTSPTTLAATSAALNFAAALVTGRRQALGAPAAVVASPHTPTAAFPPSSPLLPPMMSPTVMHAASLDGPASASVAAAAAAAAAAANAPSAVRSLPCDPGPAAGAGAAGLGACSGVSSNVGRSWAYPVGYRSDRKRASLPGIPPVSQGKRLSRGSL